MKIVTLNTWAKKGPYEKRFPLILKELERLKPDILCLQEVFDADLINLIRRPLEFVHSYESFPAGLVILSRYPFLHTLARSYQHNSAIDANDRRMIHVSLKAEEKLLHIANTHLPWKSEDDPVREANTKELAEYFANIQEPILLMGDFNTTPKTTAIQTLKKNGFVDLFHSLHPDQNGFTWDNARNHYLKTHSVIFPDQRIDLILAKNLTSDLHPIRSELAFTELDSYGELPSDHFGVLIEIFTKNSSLIK